jgi:glycosyltransferase involved in cell wall biosynthesis
MKICMLNPFSKFAAVRQFNLAKALAKKGHNITLILPKFDKYSGFKSIKIEKIKNLRIIHPTQISSKILELSMIFYIPSAIKKAMEHKYDIVHGFRPTPFSGFIGYKIAKKQKIPFILEMGDIEWETMKDLGIHPNYRVNIIKRLEKKLIENANGITVMNDNVKKYIVKNYKIKKPIKIISNGVDCDIFKPKKESSLKKILLNKTKSKKLLMFSGKLDHVSHITDLIKVMKMLDKSYGLVIIGEGIGKKKLKGLAEKLRIDNKIYFVGSLPHYLIPKYLNAADILLAPFKKEKGVEYASNLKIFEYMAVGKPIVASDVGVMKEILEGKRYIYKPGDLKEMIEKIKNVDKRIGLRTREKAVKKYGWKILGNKLERFYGDLSGKSN